MSTVTTNKVLEMNGMELRAILAQWWGLKPEAIRSVLIENQELDLLGSIEVRWTDSVIEQERT